MVSQSNRNMVRSWCSYDRCLDKNNAIRSVGCAGYGGGTMNFIWQFDGCRNCKYWKYEGSGEWAICLHDRGRMEVGTGARWLKWNCTCSFHSLAIEREWLIPRPLVNPKSHEVPPSLLAAERKWNNGLFGKAKIAAEADEDIALVL